MYKIENGRLFWADTTNGHQTEVELPKEAFQAMYGRIGDSDMAVEQIRSDFNLAELIKFDIEAQIDNKAKRRLQKLI